MIEVEEQSGLQDSFEITHYRQSSIHGGKQDMHDEIVALPKDQWKGTTIPLTTRNDS